MSKLNGEWLAFYLDGKNTAEGLIQAIKQFNERFGVMPRAVVINPNTNLYQPLANTAKRLGLGVLESERLPPKDFWLGPVKGEQGV